jgi:predicted nucleotidyltransferase
MELQDFYEKIENAKSDEELLDFCRKYVLHGTPFIFSEKEDLFYDFRKRIGKKFDISFHEIYITGSAKLGFSLHKKTIFDLDSDIDVALISPMLFDTIMNGIAEYQMQYRKNREVVREKELKMYHDFLEYVAIGWIRPDKLPISFQMKGLKDDWFEFFREISYGKSEVGNYHVAGGVFKTYDHLENYLLSGVIDIKKSLKMRKK